MINSYKLRHCLTNESARRNFRFLRKLNIKDKSKEKLNQLLENFKGGNQHFESIDLSEIYSNILIEDRESTEKRYNLRKR